MTMLTTPEQIQRYQLCVLRAAVKLEAQGLKRRGRSATVLAKEQLGLAKSTPRDTVIQRLTELIG